MEREYSIDFLKAFSLFGVVYIHGGFLLSSKEAFFSANYFRFGVPVFIVISFYLAEKIFNSKKYSGFNLYNRIKRLCLPFIIWSLMYFSIFFNYQNYNLKNIITKHFLGYGWSGQYFFLILIQLTILFYFIKTYKKRIRKLELILSFFLTILIYIIYHSFSSHKVFYLFDKRFFLYWIYYLLLGIWSANNKAFFDRIINQNSIKNFIATSIIFLIPLLLIIDEKYLHNSDANPYLSVSTLVASSIVFLSGFAISINNKLKNILSLIGKYSLGIFCLNPLVIYLFKLIKEKSNFSVTNLSELSIIYPFISTVIIFTTCLFLSISLSKMGLKKLVC